MGKRLQGGVMLLAGAGIAAAGVGFHIELEHCLLTTPDKLEQTACPVQPNLLHNESLYFWSELGIVAIDFALLAAGAKRISGN